MAQTSSNAKNADFFGEGVGSGAKAPAKRPVSADGLKYLDTGEQTPLAIQRQQLLRGQLNANQVIDTNFKPSDAKDPQNYKYDAQKGLYYTEVAPGTGGAADGRLYVSNTEQGADSPTFTVNKLPSSGKDYSQVLKNGLGLAAAGSSAGVPGAIIGGVTGALSGLPNATGQGLYLTAGDPSQVPGRTGTAAEAQQANTNYGATGNSAPPGGGTNYFPTSQAFNGGTPNVAQYTPTMGTNGGSALSSEAQRIVQQAGQMAQQSQTRANSFYDQAAAAGQRAAPQMAMPSSANQQAVYDRAMGFSAQSGADAIRAERADISGAGRLENMQMDMQGINNLESFQNTNSQQGVSALYGFRPDATYLSANKLDNYQATNTAEGANAVGGFNPDMVQQDAESLRNFKSDRSGIDKLNAYANEAQGPSAAQAMLRAQADEDKRTQLAISRSGRGAAGQVQAQRQAMAEGGLIEAQTRGQGAALAAQETDAYKSRQLQALAQAGSLISSAEAQRLQGLAAAGSLMSAADAQKLDALKAYGALKAQQDQLQLSAKQSAGQLNAAGDNMVLGATSNAAALQGDMDARNLSATSTAAGLRTQQDSIRSNNLQAAGQIRLSGSEINQRGAIAASNADLQAQALNLQSLSLAGQVSSDIRNQDINVLRSNLDASLQTLGLNDNQVRFFNQLGSDREVASQNLQQQASALGINAQQAQAALDLQWQQFGLQSLSQQQQMQYNYAALQQSGQLGNAQLANQSQQNAQQASAQQFAQQQANRNNTLNLLGSAFTAFGQLAGNGNAAPKAPTNLIAPVAGLAAQNLSGQNTSQPSGYNAMGMVYDPFTGQYVYPSQQTAQSGGQTYTPPAGGGTSFGI